MSDYATLIFLGLAFKWSLALDAYLWLLDTHWIKEPLHTSSDERYW